MHYQEATNGAKHNGQSAVQSWHVRTFNSTTERLHWLPVKFRIKYKVCLLTFSELYSHGPEYMTQMFVTRVTWTKIP